MRRHTRWSSTRLPIQGCARQGWCSQTGCSWVQSLGTPHELAAPCPAVALLTPGHWAAAEAADVEVVAVEMPAVAAVHAELPAAAAAAVALLVVVAVAAVEWQPAAAAVGGSVGAVAAAAAAEAVVAVVVVDHHPENWPPQDSSWDLVPAEGKMHNGRLIAVMCHCDWHCIFDSKPMLVVERGKILIKIHD